MDFKKDYYQLLEVSVTASKEDIRSAFRRLAKLYHPDKNPGDTIAEEKFKLVNEANEVLSNDINRHEYDAYRAEQERWAKEQLHKGKEEPPTKKSNQRVYTIIKTVTTETRIYLKGSITVKYWGDCEEKLTPGYNTELEYRINPTEAFIKIEEENIYPVQGIPLDYLKAFKESELFKMPIPQPIRCEVKGKNEVEYFELHLHDIRIKNIKLEGVTKHEGKSYGTLKGEFYGYSPKFTDREVKETVTECFGETGKAERKGEGDTDFFRKEYYHPDCTTYWGNWIAIPKPGRESDWAQPTRRFARFKGRQTSFQTGCGLSGGIITLLALLVLFPKFFIFCLILFTLGLLFYQSDTIFSSIGRLFSVFSTALILVLLIIAARSFTDPGSSYITKQKNVHKSNTTRSIREIIPEDSSATAADTLINHYIKWQDYTGKAYEGNLAVSAAAVRNARYRHKVMGNDFYQDFGEIYRSMLYNDSSHLQYIYYTFDSIRSANNLDEVEFSQLIVSAIQSQPYYLVLDKGCDENYNDDFTRNYLANCNTECCIGNELFGVRSPLEFLSDLKGDCDTRSLLLYQILKHYNYNVVLLTSNEYRHAMIAVNFSEPVTQAGLNININNEPFYLWETTRPNLNYGDISAVFNNLSYWNISLLNKKIKYEINP